MSQSFIWTRFILLVILCILMAHLFLTASKQGAYRKAFWLKGAAGLCFIAAGILAAVICPDSVTASWILAGLIFGLAGDQLLALRFVFPQKNRGFFAAGGSCFAIGHILYFFALLHNGHIRPAAAIPAAVVGLAACALYARIRKTDGGPMKPLLMGYLALLSIVNACAWSAAAGSVSQSSLIFAAGTLLFLISDNILFAYCFGPRATPGMYRAVHGTYYAAQLCIAAAIGLPG